jgi:hypothetical protein
MKEPNCRHKLNIISSKVVIKQDKTVNFCRKDDTVSEDFPEKFESRFPFEQPSKCYTLVRLITKRVMDMLYKMINRLSESCLVQTEKRPRQKTFTQWRTRFAITSKDITPRHLRYLPSNCAFAKLLNNNTLYQHLRSITHSKTKHRCGTYRLIRLNNVTCYIQNGTGPNSFPGVCLDYGRRRPKQILTLYLFIFRSLSSSLELLFCCSLLLQPDSPVCCSFAWISSMARGMADWVWDLRMELPFRLADPISSPKVLWLLLFDRTLSNCCLKRDNKPLRKITFLFHDLSTR